MNQPKNKHWLYQKRNRPKLWGILVAILILTLIPEFFVHHHARFFDKGIHIDASWGFYTWFAFASCLLMVVIAKILGLLLKRRDNYYSD